MKRTVRHLCLGLGFAAAVVTVASSACGKERPFAPGDGGTSSAGPSGAPAPENLAISLSAARVVNGRVQVDYALADAQGAPVAGAKGVVANWTLATVANDPATNRPAWTSLITRHVKGAKGETDQPTSETNGTTEDLGGGKYRYTYAASLPAGADLGATYRAGVYAQRPIAGTVPQQSDVANGVLDFVPSGGTPQPHDAVSTQACNQCHGVLQAHGGFRRETRLCATCHTTQLVDPDTNDTGDPSRLNPLDLPTLVHRIHRGRDLPTVTDAAATGDADWKYHVVGFQNSDNVYAATRPNPNPASGQPALVTTGVGFPQDLRSCAVCHAPGQDAQGASYASGAAEAWKTPSVRTCQSCHDATAFTSGETSAPHHHPHPGGLVDQGLQSCSPCHTSGGRLDVANVHQATTASPSFDAFKFQITGVTADGGGDVSASKPVKVAFKVLNADGTAVKDLSGFQGANGRLAVTISGPTTEYQAGNVVTQTVPTAASDTGDYSVSIPFPQGATPTGTWAAGIEGRRKNTTLSTSSATVFDFGRNPVSYFRIGGGDAQPRRQVVKTENCNQCHGVLSAHGDLRHDVEYCVMCHTPDNDDGDQRAAATKAGKPILDKLARRTIHFDALIHSIHTGEDLQIQKPFIVYGFGGNPTFLDEARFPGSRANCGKCHTAGTFTADALPQAAAPTPNLQVGAAPTGANGAVTSAGQLGTLPPLSAACLSCHDTADAHHHVADMSQPPANPNPAAGESCRMCHGEGGPVPVSQVHAQAAR